MDRSATKRSPWKSVSRDRLLYLMLIPGVLFFLVFRYGPMFGLITAFKDFTPMLGMLRSPWVGLKHFERFFSDPGFLTLLRNTVVLALYNIAFFFPLPIILALMLNEVSSLAYKRVVQSIIYMPHFVSWVVVAGISYTLLSNQGGAINEMIIARGGEAVNFLGSPRWFRPLIVFQSIWKESGWGTIIFLAALSGVDIQLYEAAIMDGANRARQLWHITLPAIKSTIVILFILRIGNFLDTGFEQIFLMLNSMNRGVGEVFDTYVYWSAMQSGLFSYATAVGFFKSVVSLVLVVLTNWLARKAGEEGVY